MITKKFLVTFTITDSQRRSTNIDEQWITESMKYVGFLNSLGGFKDLQIYELKPDKEEPTE